MKSGINYFKVAIIILVFVGIAGSTGYIWQKNEIKKEQEAINNEIELNLSFFTSDFPKNSTASRTESIAEWVSVYNDLEFQKYYKGTYQKGFNKNGQMYFRIVQRNANPPALTFYWMDNNLENNQLRTSSIFISECLPDKEIEYFMKHYNGDNNQGSLNCSKNGQYLFSTLQHTFSSSEVKKDWEYSQNANGFLLKFNIRESMANELLKNKTLLKLNESE